MAWIIAWLWAAGLTLAGAGVLGGFFLLVQGGARDWVPMFIWTVPLAVVMGLLGVALCSLRRSSFWLPALVGALLGTVFGFLWTVAVVVVLGPWFGAFSLPLIWCWMGGGALGAAVPPPRAWQPRWAGLVAGALLLTSAGLLGTPWVSARLAGPQAVELVFIQWDHGPNPLQIQGDRAALTEAELAQLRATGLTGVMRVAGRARHGRGAASRLVVVLEGPPASPVQLAIPAGPAVIYLVGPAGTQLLPATARLGPREVVVEAQAGRIRYSLDVAGGRVAASAFQWR